jgi:hypothetical protein
MSENENGFTQRVGRALAYGVWRPTNRLRARDEVEAAQSRQTSTHLAPVVPLHEVEDAIS